MNIVLISIPEEFRVRTRHFQPIFILRGFFLPPYWMEHSGSLSPMNWYCACPSSGRFPQLFLRGCIRIPVQFTAIHPKRQQALLKKKSSTAPPTAKQCSYSGDLDRALKPKLPVVESSTAFTVRLIVSLHSYYVISQYMLNYSLYSLIQFIGQWAC